MECKLLTDSDSNINLITSNHFYNYINDIPTKNLLEFQVKKISEEETNVNKLEKHLNTIYEVSAIFYRDSDKIKRTTNVNIINKQQKIPKRVLERQNLPKFGLAKESNDGVTTIGDEVFIVPPNLSSIDKKSNIKVNSNDLSIIKNNPNMKFSDRRKLRTFKGEKQNDTSSTISDDSGPQKYKPPRRRSSSMLAPDKKYTVFVSGFNSNFSRYDLKDVMPNNVNINRVSIPMDRNNNCKGFMFIDLQNDQDMQFIISYFNGKLYDHMVLKANEKKAK